MFMPQGSPCLIHVFVLMKHSRKRRRRSDVIERRRFFGKGSYWSKKKKRRKLLSLIYKSEVIDIYPYPSLNPNEEGRRGGEWEESQRNVSRGSSRRGGKALTQSVWLMTTIKVGKRGREEKKTETVMQGTWGWSKVMNIIIREKERKKKNAGLQIRPKRVVGSVFIPRWSWKTLTVLKWKVEMNHWDHASLVLVGY